jgi:hypothetical protein
MRGFRKAVSGMRFCLRRTRGGGTYGVIILKEGRPTRSLQRVSYPDKGSHSDRPKRRDRISVRQNQPTAICAKDGPGKFLGYLSTRCSLFPYTLSESYV